jgi:hypothetical protein
MTDPVRRVNYFFGQLLTADDLQAEQDYHRQMRYLHNRLLGQGVVDGLEVTAGGDGSTIVVSPGLAIDGFGRELVLPHDVQLELCDDIDPDGSLDVTATWAEQPDSFVPSMDGTADGTTDGTADGTNFTRWLELPELALVRPGECETEALVLARVQLSGGTVSSLDPSPRSVWRRTHLQRKGNR